MVIRNSLKGRIALWITENPDVANSDDAIEKLIVDSISSRNMLSNDDVQQAKTYFDKWYSKAERDLRISEF